MEVDDNKSLKNKDIQIVNKLFITEMEMFTIRFCK